MFSLHPTLESDTVLLGHFPLCLVLLHKDSNYPWCILVPQKPSITEIYQMDMADQIQLIKESATLSESMVSLFAPSKMNVAALGNQVSQLHIHHVARFKNDGAWPNPVWGAQSPTAYDQDALAKRVTKLRSALDGDEFTISDEVPVSKSTFSQTIET